VARATTQRLSRPDAEVGKEGLILVADDDEQVRDVLRRWLERAGYAVKAYEDGQLCLDGLSQSLPDAVCLDLDMPNLGGIETLKRVKARNRLLPVIILTADRSLDSAVSAMRLGAYDYVVKPFDSANLLTRIKNAVERYRMGLRLSQLEREVEQTGYPGIVGVSRAMKELYRQMDRLAASDITVLVQGESGTGKELVARAIHETSGRSSGEFVALNCAAIPETLQESELFGHEKGAFTGATARYRGRFEQADGGTLFLDEVAELSLGLQAKLLRVLQERRFHRVGGAEETRSDFRLVAATHRDLAEAVQEGRFREDLYFRIAVVDLDVPPLRERTEDIPPLCQQFLEKASRPRGAEAQAVTLAPETLSLLMAYSWPGNVRELQNVLQRAVVLSSRPQILPQDLPARLLESPEKAAMPLERVASLPSRPEEAIAVDPSSLNLDDVERRVIERALHVARGNLSEVGRLLGVSRNTLYRKLKRHGLHELREAIQRSS
jgi:DNA-binding NtrC family response regulator